MAFRARGGPCRRRVILDNKRVFEIPGGRVVSDNYCWRGAYHGIVRSSTVLIPSSGPIRRCQGAWALHGKIAFFPFHPFSSFFSFF